MPPSKEKGVDYLVSADSEAETVTCLGLSVEFMQQGEIQTRDILAHSLVSTPAHRFAYFSLSKAKCKV